MLSRWLAGSHQLPPSAKPRILRGAHEIDYQLGQLCRLPGLGADGAPAKVSNEVLLHVSNLVHSLDVYNSRPVGLQWHFRPRIYLILRAINALELMPSFVEYGISDIALPFGHQTLPKFLENSMFRETFLSSQACVLMDERRLELTREHIYFNDTADAYFTSFNNLGSGSFGQVDAVFSKLSLRSYARKRMARRKDSETAQRLLGFIEREISILKTLSHRHLVEAVGSYTDMKWIAYLMEPLADCNLHEYLQNFGKAGLSNKASLRNFFGCLASAVDYLHVRQIRHRDLKPQNVLVKAGHVYIGDFGAALDGAGLKQSKTQDRNVPMTPEYMAPEAAHGLKGYPSDIWSLGIIYLEMVTVLAGYRTNSWETFLGSKATPARREPYAYLNLPAIPEWIHRMQNSKSLAAKDNEPLIWTAELLKIGQSLRPTSKNLVRMITESLYFREFCCVECREEFTSEAFFDDDVVPNVRNDFVTQEQEVEKFIAFTSRPAPGPFLSADKKRSITSWLGDGQVQPFLGHASHSLPPAMPGGWFDTIVGSPPESEEISETASRSGRQTPDRIQNDHLHEADLFRTLNDDSSSDSSEQSRRNGALESLEEDLFRVVESPSSEDSDGLSTDGSIVGPPPAFESLFRSIPEEAEDDDDSVDLPDNVLPIIEKVSNDIVLGTTSCVSQADPKPLASQEKAQSLLRTSPEGELQDEPLTYLNEQPLQNHEPTKESTTAVSSWQGAPMEPSVARLEQGSSLAGLKGTSGNVAKLASDGATKTLPLLSWKTSIPPNSGPSRGVGFEKGVEQPEPDAHNGLSTRTSFLIPPPPPLLPAPLPPAPPQSSPANPSKHSGTQSGFSNWLKGGKSGQKRRRKQSRKRPRKLDSADDLFDPASYIDKVWEEMEAVESVATSVMSMSTKKLVGNVSLSRVFDRDNDLLEHCCKDGKVGAVRHLLDRSCNPGTTRKPRPKPLLLAIKGASQRHNKCVRTLILKNCDVNAVFRGKTPIHLVMEGAWFVGYHQLLALMLAAGAKLDAPDGNGNWPLHKLFAGATDDPLEDYRNKALALLLHSRVPTSIDVNVRQPVSFNTALHLAVRRRSAPAVATLIFRGADVNATNVSGTTPLLMAASQWRGPLSVEQELVLKYLLKADDLDLDVVGGTLNRTALHNAIVSGSVTAVEMLLEKGANSDMVDAEGKNAQTLVSEKSENSSTPEVWQELRTLLEEFAQF